MPRTLSRPRLLPATIAAMSLLLLVKTVSFARDAMGEPALPAQPAGGAAPANAPSASDQAVKLPPAASQTAPVTPSTPVMQDTAPPPPSAGPAVMAAGPPPPPSAAMPAAPGPPAPEALSMSSAERSLLLDLRKRRQQLDERSATLDERDAVQAAAEAKLAARVDQLAALQTRLETLEAGRRQHASENWSGLVHVYEAMKPRDAATIFDALDMQVLLQVLDRMQDRKAAPVLAAMQPDRARLATQLLAEMRLRAVAADQGAATHPPDPHG